METSKLNITGVVASWMNHDFKYEQNQATLQYHAIPLKFKSKMVIQFLVILPKNQICDGLKTPDKSSSVSFMLF